MSDLLDLRDKLDEAIHLVDAAFMAAAALADPAETNAIQSVLDIADKRVKEVKRILEKFQREDAPQASVAGGAVH